MKFSGGSRPSGVRRLFRLRAVDQAPDIAEELQFHIDATREELIASGMSNEQAEAAATARFGNIADISQTLLTLTHQRERIVQRTERFDAFKQDVRFGLRQLRKAPGFTVVALFTLALGIGANTAIFSIVYSVLLRPLPYVGAERLLDISQGNESGRDGRVVPYGNFAVWQQRAKQFEALGAYEYLSSTLTGIGEPIRLRGLQASAGLWSAQYIKPELGRYYDRSVDVRGAPSVVVLSYALWSTTFGHDATIIGRNVLLDGQPHQVVAVAAKAYSLTPGSAQFWVPLALTPEQRTQFGDHELTVVGLLRNGVTLEQGAAELTRIDTELAKAHPDMGFDGRVIAKSLMDAVVGDAKQQYLLLLGAVGLVLLIACSNVANLVLARSATRRTEMAVRRALGATRARLIAQLTIEGCVLAAGGAVLGLGVGAAGIRLLVAATPPGVPRIEDASLNPVVLAFTVALSIASALFFALLPAIKSAGINLQDALRDGGREVRGHARDSVRRILIVSEIALALVLLTGAGLLLRSGQALQRVPVGFNASNLLMGRIGLPAPQYKTPEAVAAAFTQIVDRVRSVPGITSASMIARAPIDRGGGNCEVRPEGSEANGKDTYNADFRSTMPAYFATMQIPLLSGREFTTLDRATSPLVVVVNSALAKQLFGETNPIGKRIVQCIGTGDGRSGPAWREIVGVVGDVYANGRAQSVPMQVFYPITQFEESQMTLVVRSDLPTKSLTASIRREIAAVDPQLALASARTMQSALDAGRASARFTTLLFTLLGVTGLVLAMVGIYGVIAYFVTQRTHEMGIRMALGASENQVTVMVLRQGLVLGLVGVGIGEFIAYLSSNTLSRFVFGVSVRDPLTFVSVGVMLAAVAIVASLLPARRATRVDPLTALRS